MFGFFYNIIKVIILIVLPFAALVRGATYLHVYEEWSVMACLVGSAVITSIIMFIYFSFFYGKLTGRFGSFDAMKRRAFIALLIVVVYSMHGILFFSSSNLKNPQLKQEMNNLHPILRLSLSTLIYVDKELVITDASRVVEDYKKMGLPANNKSLHIKQPGTNYAHAVDLRTKNRSELKNQMVKAYFKLMGFNTIRHGGTADHLHVSLKSHAYPNSK